MEALKDHPIIQKLCDATQFIEVFGLMHETCISIGGDKFSYHFTPAFDSQTSTKARVFARGFSKQWITLYNDGALRKIDPIPDTIMEAGRVMSWSDAIEDAKLTEAEGVFVSEARKNGLKCGVGFPLWGPKQRDAYAAIGFPEESFDADKCTVVAEQMVLQAAHQRICELIPVDDERPRLSARESEILHWVGKGKSNTDIATILGLSPDTVATYLGRAYTKLGSRDRVGATVRALKLGLINL
ncbi:MAG: LuxR family transcriptional regulator [Pseudomonadota bacterium]